MMPRPRMAALLALVAVPLFVPTRLPAAGPPSMASSMPRLFGSFQPVPGSWSEYSVVDTATGKKSRMKMAIVGKEGDSAWYEVHQDDGDSRNIIKMLVKGNPNEPDNIQRLILKSGDNPATEMPTDFVAMGRKMAVHMFEKRSGVPADADAGKLKVVEKGKSQVQVPAGTFQATLQEIVDQDGKVLATSYYNDQVLPFGVLSSVTDGSRMELLGHGRDARSAITETPATMSAPPGMPAGMPRGMPPGMGKQQP